MVNRTAIVRDAVIIAVCLLTIFSTGIFGVTKLTTTLERSELSDSFELSELVNFAARFGLSDLTNLFDSLPTANSLPPATSVSKAKADVIKVRFFEESNKIPPSKDRKYATEFPVATTRFIFTEISFKHKHFKKSDSEIPLTIEYYNAAGKRVAHLERVAKIKKEWSTASYATGWGKTSPGSWENGKYNIKLFVEGQLVGEYSFMIR